MKKSTINMLILFGILGTLLIVFGFFDLKISQALFNAQSVFGRFLDVWGEGVSLLIGAFCAAILLVCLRTSSGANRGIGNIVFTPLLVLNCAMLCFIPMMRMEAMNIAVGIAAALVICALVLALAAKLQPTRRWKRIAWIGLFYSLSGIIIVNVIKPLWGRVRFREMAAPFHMFSAWYVPQFAKWRAVFEDPASFPSGHTANAAVILLITLLPSVFPKLKGKEPILWAISLIYIAAVALSRIIVGAHFASDVTMSVIIQLGAFLLIKKNVNSKMGYSPLNNSFAKQ